MDMNEYEHNGEQLPTDSGEADRESSVPSDGVLHDEIRRLRIQLERLEAFQQTPQSHESDSADEASTDNHADHPNSPAEPKQARHRSPMRMALVAIAAVVLCVGGLQLLKYLQSYQDTDDAEVDGYLDPISTRINGTVSAVYVDNNRSVKTGQLLLQLDPPTTRSPWSRRARNLRRRKRISIRRDSSTFRQSRQSIRQRHRIISPSATHSATPSSSSSTSSPNLSLISMTRPLARKPPP